MTNPVGRRVFLGTALAAVPAAFVGQRVVLAQGRQDPMLQHFEREALRLHRDVEQGAVSSTHFNRYEALLRTQAVYLPTIGADAQVKAMRRRKTEVLDHVQTHRGHLKQELKQRHGIDLPDADLAPDRLDAAFALLTTEGISPHFGRMAELMKQAGEATNGRRLVRVSSQQDWWSWGCNWWGGMNDADAQFLQIYCAMAILAMGPVGETICALWAIESGISTLFHMWVC